MKQAEVADIIGVTTDSITGWELNRHTPPPKYIPLIVEYLGYIPYDLTKKSIGEVPK